MTMTFQKSWFVIAFWNTRKKRTLLWCASPSPSKYFISKVQFWHTKIKNKKLFSNMASNETWKFVVFVHSLLQTNNHVEKKRKRTNFCHRKWAANLILAFSTPSIVYYWLVSHLAELAVDPAKLPNRVLAQRIFL